MLPYTIINFRSEWVRKDVKQKEGKKEQRKNMGEKLGGGALKRQRQMERLV
jgi:hypothetical protein